MESYVLRVYRRKGARLVGTVEETTEGHQSSFHNAEDLWQALLEPVGSRQVREPAARGSRTAPEPRPQR